MAADALAPTVSSMSATTTLIVLYICTIFFIRTELNYLHNLSFEQGKSEGFDSCNRPSNWIQIINCSACVTLKFDRWPEKQQGTSFILSQALCIISNPVMNSNWSYSLETLSSGRNWWYFVLCDLEIWWMAVELNMAPLLYYIKLCASFQSHGWVQTGVTVRKRSFQVQVGNFCPCDLEIWWMTLKNNRAHFLGCFKLCLLYSIAISELKLEFHSEKAQFGSKLTIYFSRVTLKFDRRPSKTIGHLF